ncbi:MAG: glycoside hydrolase family 10 protein [Candidatus Saccharicenans sp.]|uniref:glycoside hydrolase family 10 protein n=1 Tax=Candidatus Saccharicenans sp. TaxID=2819258 RepID=UPI00404A1BBF
MTASNNPGCKKLLSILAILVIASASLVTAAEVSGPVGQKLKPIKEPKIGLPASALQPWVVGVWMHPGMFGREKEAATEKISQTLDEYLKAGINSLFMLVKNTTGHVYYDTEIGVKDPAYDWDFFGLFLEEARKRKMTVHPWFCVFPESALLGQVREHPEWLIVGPGREMVRTVNPALPEVRAYEISLMLELVNKYGVDWVHLDYIRFPCEPTEPYFSRDARTLQLFKEETGIDFNALKARDSGNPYWNVWLEWNREQVTRFVRELRQELGQTGHQVKISAAVFPDADNARVLIGQNWLEWGRQGLVDMLCPMLYTNDLPLFEKLTKRALVARESIGRQSGAAVMIAGKTEAQAGTSIKERTADRQKTAAAVGGGVRAGTVLVCPGIGIGTSHNQATPEIMLEEIRLARQAGADGVVFFSGGSLKEPFLKALAAPMDKK